jgi:hypothetical protein
MDIFSSIKAVLRNALEFPRNVFEGRMRRARRQWFARGAGLLLTTLNGKDKSYDWGETGCTLHWSRHTKRGERREGGVRFSGMWRTVPTLTGGGTPYRSVVC